LRRLYKKNRRTKENFSFFFLSLEVLSFQSEAVTFRFFLSIFSCIKSFFLLLSF